MDSLKDHFQFLAPLTLARIMVDAVSMRDRLEESGHKDDCTYMANQAYDVLLTKVGLNGAEYLDSMGQTVRLVAAAANETGKPVDPILKLFFTEETLHHAG